MPTSADADAGADDWMRASVERVTRQYSQSNPFTQAPSGEFEFDGPVPSSSNPDVTYHVIVRHGFASCTCKGFQFNHKCSHIRTIQQALDQR